MFDRFPHYLEILYALPIYVVILAIIFFIQKQSLMSSGLAFDYKTDGFSMTSSLVFSSFFLTILPTKIKQDDERSTIPEKINIFISSKMGSGYQEMNRRPFIQNRLLPKSYLNLNLYASLLGSVLILIFINTTDPYLASSIRLAASYVGGFILTEMAPIFGRRISDTVKVGKIRSYLAFAMGVIITIIALFGNTFLRALMDRF